MKQKVCDLDDLFYQLKDYGLTRNQMKKQYNLTEWGSRKIADHDALTSTSESGNHEKVYVADVNGGIKADNLRNMEVPVKEEEPNYEETQRQTTDAKQTITNKANTYLSKLENMVKNSETPDIEYEEPAYSDDGFTAIIHETDSHFSAHVKNSKGETVYDTKTAEKATENAFNWYLSQIMNRGEPDEIVLLLGGDLVEGEDIYEGQAHHVEDTLQHQIETARTVYYEMIARIRTAFPASPLKIVCVSGNHGDMGTGSGANADDIIYSSLEDMISLSTLQNIKFVKSDRSDYTTFTYRNWNGYLTHGENRSRHIGTSSPKSDWLAIKDKFGFDAAWRGHYHNQKQENVNGAPVCMTNSRKPGDDYTDTIATFGVTGNAIYFATDDEPLEAVEVQTGVLPQ